MRTVTHTTPVLGYINNTLSWNELHTHTHTHKVSIFHTILGLNHTSSINT